MFIVDALSFTRGASSGSGFSGMTVPRGTSGGVGKAAKFVTIYFGVGISVHMSHTCFDLRATTVQEGGVTGSTLIIARAGQLVDSCERSTTDELAEAIQGLEGTSGQRITGQVRFTDLQRSKDGTHLTLVPIPARVGGGPG